MALIQLNFNNFSDSGILLQNFSSYPNEYEFTGDKIFRMITPPFCPKCKTRCTHNGYNYIQKKNVGRVKIGKYECPECGHPIQEDKSFFKKLLDNLHEWTSNFFLVLRKSRVSWQGISNIMNFVFPIGKTKALNLFNKRIEQFEYPKIENICIVHYDEQHPKKGRNQKFRLTLLNVDGRVIADELFDDKKRETIKAFLLKHLDPNKHIMIITDCDETYPKIFKEIWDKKVIHQKCLLHLNKLVSKDFGKYTKLGEDYNKYSLFNIFYDRSKELKKLQSLVSEYNREKFKTKKEKKEWIKDAKKRFYKYVRKLEKKRRRKKTNLPKRTLKEAEKIFSELWLRKASFKEKIRKRLKMILESWKELTAFYHVEGLPATNNKLENFYSVSLKTHRKKQFRTKKGIINQLKLSALVREVDINKPEITFFELFRKILSVVS